jgi:hypothetical protein
VVPRSQERSGGKDEGARVRSEAAKTEERRWVVRVKKKRRKIKEQNHNKK